VVVIAVLSPMHLARQAVSPVMHISWRLTISAGSKLCYLGSREVLRRNHLSQREDETLVKRNRCIARVMRGGARSHLGMTNIDLRISVLSLMIVVEVAVIVPSLMIVVAIRARQIAGAERSQGEEMMTADDKTTRGSDEIERIRGERMMTAGDEMKRMSGKGGMRKGARKRMT
jgi:hypothetical protein